jgi:hypothetical protein
VVIERRCNLFSEDERVADCSVGLLSKRFSRHYFHDPDDFQMVSFKYSRATAGRQGWAGHNQ